MERFCNGQRYIWLSWRVIPNVLLHSINHKIVCFCHWMLFASRCLAQNLQERICNGFTALRILHACSVQAPASPSGDVMAKDSVTNRVAGYICKDVLLGHTACVTALALVHNQSLYTATYLVSCAIASRLCALKYVLRFSWTTTAGFNRNWNSFQSVLTYFACFMRNQTLFQVGFYSWPLQASTIGRDAGTAVAGRGVAVKKLRALETYFRKSLPIMLASVQQCWPQK